MSCAFVALSFATWIVTLTRRGAAPERGGRSSSRRAVRGRCDERADLFLLGVEHAADAVAGASDVVVGAVNGQSELACVLAAVGLLTVPPMLPAARAEVESVEVGFFAARNEGSPRAQIAEAMGFRSPQTCQQYVNQLTARQDRRP